MITDVGENLISAIINLQASILTAENIEETLKARRGCKVLMRISV